ncbi:hypothetical protein LK03_10460 [Pseudomonas cremoricolorata]|uniref:Uncharacterized protein n=2 Tax=Pseudomonas cremoricolorata TaxID=157783 RepID=A0A089WK85_9PSED|nr:hypothetical protein LK03_10460 [Pseudomonas cremoricolorata]
MFWPLLVICLGQALWVFLSWSWRPDPSMVLSATPVGEGGAIYEVLYDSGGATGSYVYRYFVMERQPSEAALFEKTRKAKPFLVTKMPGAVREVVGTSVKLRTRDTLYDFHNVASFKVGGQLTIVRFYLDATRP